MPPTEFEPLAWLLLIHQLPPKPAYLRVKIGRRLARIGSVALKNTVYVLPNSDAALEDFQWLRREISDLGGEATLLQASLIDGLTDAQVESLFSEAREPDYQELIAELRSLEATLVNTLPIGRAELEPELQRMERRFREIAAIDFFDAPSRQAANQLLKTLRATMNHSDQSAIVHHKHEDFSDRVWVTRRGIHVDRIASAWLIRRFIDPQATFKFVPAKGYLAHAGELRFDMFEAEFSHEGELCTFEVLCQRFSLKAAGLQSLAEVVHDIDIKDHKYGRPETSGVNAQILGIAQLCPEDDNARLAQGFPLFDALLAFYAKDAH